MKRPLWGKGDAAVSPDTARAEKKELQLMDKERRIIESLNEEIKKTGITAIGALNIEDLLTRLDGRIREAEAIISQGKLHRYGEIAKTRQLLEQTEEILRRAVEEWAEQKEGIIGRILELVSKGKRVVGKAERVLKK